MTWRRGLTFFIRWIAWGFLSLLLGYGCYIINSLHTDFPSLYHPDEDGKIEQLLSGERNYKHPQLMLEAALLVLPVDANQTDPELLMAHERIVSAMFVAGAVVLLAWTGAIVAGPMGFFAVAILAGLCPPLLEAGHYLKEDASLIFGMACVLCAGAAFARTRRAMSVIGMATLLGAAAGIAASAKYCGVAFFALALLLVIVRLWRRPFWIGSIALLLLTAAAAGTWAGINYRAIDGWSDFTPVLAEEFDHSTTGHRGVALDQPNGYFLHVVLEETPWPVLALACAAPFAWLLQRRPTLFGPWLVVSIGGYLLMLALSAIAFNRYALPATVMTYVLAGLGLVWLVRLDAFDARFTGHIRLIPTSLWAHLDRFLCQPISARFAVYVIGVGSLAGVLGVRAADVNRQFADDSRDALREWVNTALPPGTRIATDEYAQLFGERAPLPSLRTQAQVYRQMWAADFGSIASLQGMGIQYVVVVSTSIDRFFSPYTHAEPGDEAWFTQRKGFYEDLAAHYPVAWQRIAKCPLHEFVNPDIRVYRISP